jgi:hypothetical protein
MSSGGVHNIAERSEEHNAARKRLSALRRRLKDGEPLTGDLLTLALSAATDEKTARKLRNGEALDEFEKHIIVDVALSNINQGRVE